MTDIIVYYKELLSTVSETDCTFSFQKNIQNIIHSETEDLFQHCLKQFGILPSQYRIEKTDTGKPYLSTHPDLHFNISHSSDHINNYSSSCIAVGFSHLPIGVDLEYEREIKNTTAKKICSDREYALLHHENNTNEYLTKLWTLKEAYVKYTGEGLRTDLSQFNFNLSQKQENYNIYTLDNHPNILFYQYSLNNHLWLTVCADSTLPPPKIFKFH